MNPKGEVMTFRELREWLDSLTQEQLDQNALVYDHYSNELPVLYTHVTVPGEPSKDSPGGKAYIQIA